MRILIPKADAWYAEDTAKINGCSQVLGPFHDSGDPWDQIKLSTDDLNLFQQGTRILTETSVYHRKLDGDIYVIPALAFAEPTDKFDVASGSQVYRVKLSNSQGTKYTFLTVLDTLLNGYANAGWDKSTSPKNPIWCGVYDRRTNDGYIRSATQYNPSATDKTLWHARNSRWRIQSIQKTTFSYQYLSVDEPRWPEKDWDTDIGAERAKQHATDLDTSSAIIRTKRDKLYMTANGFSMARIRAWMTKVLNRDFLHEIPTPELQSYGELVHHASGNLDAVSANMIAFVKDLRNIKDLVPKLKELKKVKTHAGNYLGYQYGVLPTISDLKAIWEAFQPTKYYDRGGLRRVSAYDTSTEVVDIAEKPTSISFERRVHVAVNDKDTGVDALVEKIRNIGLFPSLTNLWDLVPYSFIIDWFIDVGSVLERIDTNHRLLNLDIPYVIKTDKVEFTFNHRDESLGVGMDVEYSQYRRTVTRSVPQPKIFGDFLKPPTAQNHWVEGSALIIQRTNK